MNFFGFDCPSIDDYEFGHHQIIVENCSIASSVSENDMKLEKIQLLTNRCPSLDSRSSIRFQRLDPYHLQSTMFPINKFQSTSVVYLRCAIGICSGQIEHCQEVKFIEVCFVLNLSILLCSVYVQIFVGRYRIIGERISVHMVTMRKR